MSNIITDAPRSQYPELLDEKWLRERTQTQTIREIASTLGCGISTVYRATTRFNISFASQPALNAEKHSLGRPWQLDDKDWLIKAMVSNTYEQIGNEIGVSASVVRTAARKWNLTNKRRPRPWQVDDFEWLADAVSRMPMGDIANEIGVHRVTLWKALLRLEVPLPGGLDRTRLDDREWLAKQLENRTMVEIATEIGCAPGTVRAAVVKFDIPHPDAADRIREKYASDEFHEWRSNRWKEYEGRRFGMLVVTGPSPVADEPGRFRVTVACDCGGGKVILVSVLNRQTSGWDHCGCLNEARGLAAGSRRRVKKRKLNWAGYQDITVDDPVTGRALTVREHRWVMEQAIERPLLPAETVHHMNGVRNDNRIENLELWSSSHPPGQRVEDKVKWAREILDLYGDMFPEEI